MTTLACGSAPPPVENAPAAEAQTSSSVGALIEVRSGAQGFAVISMAAAMQH